LFNLIDIPHAVKKDQQTILVVDDQRTQTLALKKILEPEWAVETAQNGTEALKIAQGNPAPDLILLDITMPEMDGYEVCMKLKDFASTENIPVIFLTALDDQVNEAFGLQLGAVDYIIKPARASIVRARIRNHLALRNAQAELALKNQELERLAIHDRLTGLYNRRKLDESLDQEIERAARYNRPLSVIMLDLDHFKKVNDTCGHPAGDAVLVEAAVRLKKALRANDTVGRWGGEEFLIFCPETALTAAVGLAERLRQTFADQDFPEAGCLTASFGVAAYRSEDLPNKLLSRADNALYRAKNNGRNRVEQETP
jgi:diguanylate cyclase (GGDEF)-like protein